MTRLRTALHNTLTAWRPPPARTTRRASPAARELPAVVSIAEPGSIDIVAERLLGGRSSALILPAGALHASRPEASFPRALVRAAASRDNVRVGTRADAGWSRVALALGARYVALGSAGWACVDLDEHALLDAVFLPLEVERANVVLAVVDAAGTGALGFWEGVVHPHSALRALVGGDRAQMDLVAATSATYVFTLGSHTAPLVAWTADPVAAELALLAGRYLADEQRGYEQRLPWEDARVQAALERGLGVSSHLNLRMCSRLSHGAAGDVAYVQALAHVLGCAHVISNPGE